MKLLNKTNRYFIAVSLVIFCLGGILFYFLFKVVIDVDINNKLYERKDYTTKQLARTDSLIYFQHYSANMLAIKPVDKVTPSESLIDTVIFDRVEEKEIIYRQLKFSVNIKGNAYEISVRRAIVEQKALVEGVVILVGLLFAAFALGLTLINNRVSKNIWAPFYDMLDKINSYQIHLAQTMTFPKSSIDEFNELGAAIEKMSTTIHHEFTIQKEFTENASHEIQTPLAIVKSKLEVLMQSNLGKDQIELINSVSIAINRLSKLNEALIILSKIDNHQFHVVDEINLAVVIESILNGIEELMKLNRIHLTKKFEETCIARMNPFLCEILLENLIINAVKHNVPSGKIDITLNKNELQISNTSENVVMDAQNLFRRFVKANHKSQSLGLGLSIVKAVCETYSFPISYVYENGLHIVTTRFTDRDAIVGK